MDKYNYTFYKIYCKTNPDLVYIGSTRDFKERTRKHISVCNKPNNKNYNLKVYKTIRENGGWDNWLIEAIVFQDDLTEKEARVIEQILMNDFGTVNEQRAYTNNKEAQARYNPQYYQNNKEAIAEQQAQYYQNNKEAIAEQQAQYRQDNREAIAQYRQDNREALAQKKAQYYQNNKEAIAQQQAEQTTCECGSVVSRSCLARHKRTNKHCEFINNKK